MSEDIIEEFEQNDGKGVAAGNQGFSKNAGEFRMIKTSEIYSKCLGALSEELQEGFWEQKTNGKGETISVYHIDQRLKIKECVLTLVSFLKYDLEKRPELLKEIEEVIDRIEEYKEECLQKQINWFDNLHVEVQRNWVKSRFIRDILNEYSPFYHQFLKDSVEGYRRIFELCDKVIRDVHKDFSGDEFMGGDI